MPSLTSTPVQPAVANHGPVAKKPVMPHVVNGTTTTSPTPQSKNVKAGVWELRSTEFTELEAPENTESLFSGDPSESVLGEDGRKMVNKKDYMPGGKYRSVVKLFLRFAGQNPNDPWAMATGWLISNDTIVTAGHCSYDWSHNLGRLTHVKAYIGYHGKESIKDSRNYAVQFRTGKRITTTEGWLKGGSNEPRDVSFIQVDSPFTGIKPFKYQPTPMTGAKVVLGVVGYPGDLMNPKTKEKGAFMYEMYVATSFDLAKLKTHMLRYTIDTYGGNSGSPVIRQSDMASIGVHVLGGNPNSASVIAGIYGNPFDAYITALKAKPTGSNESGEATVDDTKADWLSWVTVPTKELASGGETDVSAETGAENLDNSTGDSEAAIPSEQPDSESALDEGFFNFLKKALGVSGPLGMVASVGLGVAGSLLKKKKKTEAALDAAYSFEGVAERALLGEAALTAIVRLGPSKCKDLGIFKRMQPRVLKIRPICSRAGPTIMPFVMERAWRMTAVPTQLPKKKGEAIEPARTTTPADTNTLGFGRRLDANAEAFVQMLTESITTEDAEGFVETEFKIGEVVGNALRISGPILGSVTESGLSLLAGPDGAEADVNPATENDINNPESSAYTYDAMTQRAIAGEAALEALLQTPTESLQQEGFMFDLLKYPIKTFGPKFLKHAGDIVSGALNLASSATSLAAAQQQKKKQEDAGLEPEPPAEQPANNGEADIDPTVSEESAEANFLDELTQE